MLSGIFYKTDKGKMKQVTTGDVDNDISFVQDQNLAKKCLMREGNPKPAGAVLTLLIK